MLKLQINEASDKQLSDFASDTLQLDTANAQNRAAVLALIGQAWHQDYILVDNVEPDQKPGDQVEKIEAAGSAPSQGGLGLNDPIVKLRILQTGDPGGKDPVPVSVNGRLVIIQRNLEASVPYRFYEVLMNSERVIVEQNIGVAFGHPDYGDITETKTTNYPLQIIALPSDEEVRLWRERTDNELMPA